jgi:TfoX/Sxy family transcriptional regulator of competence genes
MATQRSTIDHLLEQAAGAGTVAARPMFGEYGLYLDGRLVGLVCDDRLYLKATAGGRPLAGPVPEEPPYPGAKPQLVIEGDRWDDAEWLVELLVVTAAELPAPKPKKPKAQV